MSHEKNMWYVSDPHGLQHLIVHDKDDVWWGMENLFSGFFGGESSSAYATNGLKQSLQSGEDDGYWGYFQWLKVPTR